MDENEEPTYQMDEVTRLAWLMTVETLKADAAEAERAAGDG